MTKYIDLLKAHEKIVIAVLLILCVLYGYNKYLNHSAQTAHDANIMAQANLKQQQAANAKLAEVVSQAMQNLREVSTKVDTESKKIDADLATHRQTVVEQQRQDAIAPLPELAARWNALLNTTGAVAQGPSIVTDEPTSRATVQNLELIPLLNDEVSGANKKLDGEKEKNTACQQANAELQKSVDGLNKEIDATKTACAATVKEVKADARKSKRNWFVRGLIIGGTAVGFLAVAL
jgi:uncharacterized protein YlxW (UPF0749 family)